MNTMRTNSNGSASLNGSTNVNGNSNPQHPDPETVSQMLVDRLNAARASLAEHKLEALAVTTQHNRTYISGFTGSAGLALITAHDARLLTDSRYYEQVAREAPHFKLEKASYQTWETLGKVLADLGISKVGFEGDAVSVNGLAAMRAKLPDVEWMATSGLIELQRQAKSEQELAVIRTAVALADCAMEHAYEVASPGMTERDLAWELEKFMREHGAQSMAFELIVAAGENGALPHHRPSDRVIQAGEPIVVDIGCTVDGYNSDLTRTFSIGPARDPDYLTVYNIVLEAIEHATAQLKPGQTGIEADALARDVIKAAGYGDQFGHSLGHGVGLNVHEGPRLSYSPENTTVMAAGQVVTLEPGIYLPNRFGVRIEDMVLVRDDGVEVLTGVKKVPVLAARG